jgi:TRAP-type C4-dicarboxylate transport system substrate-binding protein
MKLPVVVVSLLLSWSAAAQTPKTITLNVVTSFPHVPSKPGEPLSSYSQAFDWMKTVEERSKGQVKFNYRGGPEAIPTFEQFSACRRGAVDVCFQPITFLANEAPVVAAISAIEATPREIHAKGIYAFLRDNVRPLGVHYVGNVNWTVQSQTIYLVQPITQPSELRGKTLRGDDSVRGFMQSLGISYTNMPPGDIYTSLERRVIDGFAWAVSKAVLDNAWVEVAKSYIDHPYGAINMGAFISLKSWNALPADVQALLTKTMQESEEAWYPRWQASRNQILEMLRQRGAKPIRFPEAQARAYVQAYFDATWATAMKEAPEKTKQLRKLAGQ